MLIKEFLELQESAEAKAKKIKELLDEYDRCVHWTTNSPSTKERREYEMKAGKIASHLERQYKIDAKSGKKLAEGRTFDSSGNVKDVSPKKSAAPVDPQFKKGQILKVKKTGQEVEVLGFRDGLVQTVEVPGLLKGFGAQAKGKEFVPARGNKEYMPRELSESLNDDDYYVVDTDAKKILKHLGKRSVPFGMDPSEVLKDYIKEPKSQKVMTGMKAKYSKITEAIKDFEEWKQAVIAKYPTKAGQLKFKGRIENGVDTISAEVPGEDRSYGVWDQDKEEGVVLTEAFDLTCKDKHSFIGRIKRGNEANNKGWGKFGAIIKSGLKADSSDEKKAEVQNLGRDANRYKNLVDRNLTPGGFPKAKAKHVERAEAKAAKVTESLSSTADAADRFKASLASRLKPLGFKRDRDLFVSDDKVISVLIDLDESDAFVNWGVGKMVGSRPKFSKSGSDPLENSAEIMKTLVSFAKGT